MLDVMGPIRSLAMAFVFGGLCLSLFATIFFALRHGFLKWFDAVLDAWCFACPTVHRPTKYPALRLRTNLRRPLLGCHPLGSYAHPACRCTR